tara:strand:+ start:40960 stop:41079 length:120 start_codon:yes stop_codon:yes gene_type:complete
MRAVAVFADMPEPEIRRRLKHNAEVARTLLLASTLGVYA